MYDVVIVGGGPGGLTAALMLGRVRRSVLLVDEGPGRNAPTDAVHGLLGHDGIPPARLRAVAHEQLTVYPTVQVRTGRVDSVAADGSTFTVRLATGEVENARRTLLATGVADQLPAIEGLPALWGRTVVHCPYCHGYELRDQPLAAIVTQPPDLLRAMRLTGLSGDVAICLNGAPEPTPDNRVLIDKAGLTVYPQPIIRLEADPTAPEQLHRIVFADGTGLDRAGLFLHPPTRQASTLPTDLGCRLLDDGSVEVTDLGQTTTPGVYAVGDMARRPDMPLPGHQVGIAAGEAQIAAVTMDQDLLHADLGIPFPMGH